ncbi:hypothetical protein CEXT_797621, partial [Caerostris extrusa]
MSYHVVVATSKSGYRRVNVPEIVSSGQ